MTPDETQTPAQRRPLPQRAPLQRVPPHDNQTEANLLGAAMIRPEAARVVATLGPDPFYRNAHQIIADTITRLTQNGNPCDTGTVAAHITNQGQVDAISGIATLTTMQAATPSLSDASIAHWADLITEHHHKRRILTAAAEVVEAVYQNLPTSGLIAGMHTQAVENDLGPATSWEPVNLAHILAGDTPQLQPTIWARADGHHLLYPGKTHAINAESEAGKSWCMQHAATQEIQQAHHVLYIDFEADAPDVTGRLLELGATPTQILDNFHYIRPDDPIDAKALLKVLAACETWQPTLAVLDGMTEALNSTGWSINDNDDIATFLRHLPRPLERTGCAVVIIDHLPKDREKQGRGGIGGEHKLSGITGADYKLESLTPFSRNNPGSSRLICDKDRHGQIRPACKDQRLAGIIHYKPLPGGYGIDISVDPYDQAGSSEPPFEPTGIMERISQTLAHGPALTSTELRGAIRGAKTETVAHALRLLVSGRYVATMREGRSVYHSNLKPYPAPQPEPTPDPGSMETDEEF